MAEVVTSRSVPVMRRPPFSASSKTQLRSGRGLFADTDPSARLTPNDRSPCWMVTFMPSLPDVAELVASSRLPEADTEVDGVMGCGPHDRFESILLQALFLLLSHCRTIR